MTYSKEGCAKTRISVAYEAHRAGPETVSCAISVKVAISKPYIPLTLYTPKNREKPYIPL